MYIFKRKFQFSLLLLYCFVLNEVHFCTCVRADILLYSYPRAERTQSIHHRLRVRRTCAHCSRSETPELIVLFKFRESVNYIQCARHIYGIRAPRSLAICTVKGIVQYRLVWKFFNSSSSNSSIENLYAFLSFLLAQNSMMMHSKAEYIVHFPYLRLRCGFSFALCPDTRRQVVQQSFRERADARVNVHIV